MKKLLAALAIAAALCLPVLAQTSFSDVPRDHWAYDAVSELESLGLVVGYPDGEFKGARTLTRYEFAMVTARLLPLLGGEGTDLGGLAKSSDLDKYTLKDPVKRGDTVDLSGFAKAEALDKIRALAEEFAGELAALGLDGNLVAADKDTLMKRADLLAEELARVRVTGKASFMVQSVLSGDAPAADYDGLAPVEKFLKRHQSFYKDVQLDITGRVNDHVNLYTTLVMTDLLNKDNRREDRYDTDTDIIPWYFYAVSSDEKWGDVRVGRMPFQINNYLFNKGTETSYFSIDRLDDHNFAVEGFDYAKDFGSFDLRLWGNRPVYDWNERKLLYIGGEKVSANGGAQLGFGFGKGRLTAVYDRLATENRVPFGKDKIDYYGGTAHVPFGEFFADAGWFRMKPNKGFKKADWWDASLGYKNPRLALKAGYKTVEDSYSALSCADKFFQTIATNYKGWFAEGSYNFTDDLSFTGQYKRYKADDASLPTLFHDVKYLKAQLNWKATDLDALTLKYELGDYRYDPASPYFDVKRHAATAIWDRRVGSNTTARLIYQYLKYTNIEKSHLVAGQLTVSF